MAFIAKGTRISMDAYDYGITLPIDVEGTNFEEDDTMLFELKKSSDSNSLIVKEFSNELQSTDLFRFFLEFSKEESESLFPGNYVYYIRYLKDGNVRDTIVDGDDFKIKK